MKKTSVPALTPDNPARSKPFFFMIKLEPMKMLEERARIRPTAFSDVTPDPVTSQRTMYPRMLLQEKT